MLATKTEKTITSGLFHCHFAISSLSEAMLSKKEMWWTTFDGTVSLKSLHCHFVVRLHEIAEGVCKTIRRFLNNLTIVSMPLSTSEKPSSPMASLALSFSQLFSLRPCSHT